MGNIKGKQFVQQKMRDTYAFVVDGGDEKWYLQLLKAHESSVRAQIKPELNANKTVEQQYDLVCELAESYTKVFWIIDLDVVIKQDAEWRAKSNKMKPSVALKSALSNISSKNLTNVYPIINTPGLEYWFLLHLESTSRYYATCDSVIDRIKKIKGSPLNDYQKSEAYYKKRNDDIYIKLKPLLKDARINAAKLGMFDVTNMQRGLSEMYVIFDQLGI